MRTIRVGVCGGIGAGKSRVCAMFAERGVAVYDCDSRAKELMAEGLRKELCEAFGNEIFEGGVLNRRLLAERVFNTPSELERLNAIVHPAVKEDFERWAEAQTGAYVVLESAILFSSGLASCVDVKVAVLAPKSLRVTRAMQRDGASREAIEARMAAQMSDDELIRMADVAIVNINLADVEADVAELDGRLRKTYAERNGE